jgi:putative intracellular protease/amidase
MSKVLLVVTNHNQFLTKKERTGLWLSEATHFYHFFKEKGYQIDFVSPNGGEAPIDPKSLKPLFIDKISKSYYNEPTFMNLLKKTLNPEVVNWRDYKAIYFAGGHGAMWDFSENKKLQEISLRIYENGGIVSAVCHGVAALLNMNLSSGEYLIKGRRVTGYSNIEEKLVMLSNQVPYSLEEEIKRRGAKFEKNILPFTPNAIVDGRIATGQNPQSAKALSKLVYNLMQRDIKAAHAAS